MGPVQSIMQACLVLKAREALFKFRHFSGYAPIILHVFIFDFCSPPLL
jgi:hypothetical protein